jgi:hypothetical protein
MDYRLNSKEVHRVEVLQFGVSISRFKPTVQYNLAHEVPSWEAFIWMVR